MLHTSTPATAVPVTHTEDLPPPLIADAVLAEAMTTPAALKRKPSIAEQYAEFLKVDRAWEPLDAARADALVRKNEAEADEKAAMDAAKAAVPLPDALRVPNFNPGIREGFITFADGTRKDFSPPATTALRSAQEINDYAARNPGIDPAPLRDALSAFQAAQLKAVAEAGPTFVAADAAFEAAAAEARPLRRERSLLFDAMGRNKPFTLAEVRMQAEVVARFAGDTVRRDGSVRIGRQMYEYDATRILNYATDIIAREGRATPLQRLGTRYDHAYTAYSAASDAAEAAGTLETDPLTRAAGERLTAIEEQIEREVCRSPADALVKAKVASRFDAGMENAGGAWRDRGDDFGTKLARSIVRDLAALDAAAVA